MGTFNDICFFLDDMFLDLGLGTWDLGLETWDFGVFS